MRSFVIDTNVLYLANGGSHTSRACEAECARRLYEIKHSGNVVVDSLRLILREYQDVMRQPGQPGAGTKFLQWLLQNSRRTTTVTITPHDVRDFEQFPVHDGLKDFDRSDRKFVAVSCAHGSFPPILQASDSKWIGWSSALEECGVAVEFLCRAEIEAAYSKKIGGL